MVNALLIESSGESLQYLEKLIHTTCPEVNISHKADSINDIHRRFKDAYPQLMFLDIEDFNEREKEYIDEFVSADSEIIFVTCSADFALDALKCGAAGYVIKPVKRDELALAVNNAVRRIKRKDPENRNKNIIEKYAHQLDNDQILGVPTIEGYEFIKIKNIIRCEGLQKCTRIITLDKTDLISSYNLGAFRKLLDHYGFFSPHKSHLINLAYIRKYHREGSIIMQNGSCVPVAKRRKKDFLDQFAHL